MTRETFIVAGAGQAGVQVCETLRKEGFSGHIILIGEEDSLPYQRPPLSKKYLLGEMTAERLLIRPAEFYADQDIETRLGVRIEQIDPVAKTVSLVGGEILSYDKLALTTGSRPRFLPEAIGGALEGVYPVRTLKDVDGMSSEFQSGRRVLIVGGGYIGLEAAAVARQMGLEVQVIEMAPRLLARVSSEQTAEYFARLHHSHGVIIRTNVGLDRLEGEGRVQRALLTDGSVQEVDFVLVGIGILPNTELAELAGLKLENGIWVTESAQTSDKDIVAAGDCACLPWRGARLRLESVHNAIAQAQVAALSMLGQKVNYDPVPWFWSDQYDVKLQMVGLNTGFDHTILRPGRDYSSQSIWYFKGERLIAVDAMNDPRAYMMGKRWLEAGHSPDPVQIADPDIALR